MVEVLKDFQNRDIFTRPEFGINGVYLLGERIFEFLKKISSQNFVRGCYFSHYFSPPENLSQVKVGIRFNDVKILSIVNDSLNRICEEKREIILHPGEFQSTSGIHPGLPKDIVVDYIICYSFEWLIRIKERFISSYPSYELLGKFLLQNKKKIEQGIISKNIFRLNVLKPIEDDVVSIIWGRFIHHLCNAYLFPKEYQLRAFLKSNGINIFLPDLY